MSQLLEHALKYAALGWKVIPIVPRQKIPLTSHGIKDATSDTDQIQKWWAKWPNANIAVACGKPSGVYVVDVDVSEAGDVNGKVSLITEFDPLPATIQQYTPRGGFHAFYHATDPPANRNSFRPGIDIRGDGYYVVVAPSIHPNGGQYAWKPNCAPWEREPAEFPNFMRPVTKAPWAAKQIAVGTIKGIPIVHVPSLSGPLSGPATPDILERASLYLEQVEAAVQGCGGHDRLLWAAVALVHGFLLSDGQVLDLLVREFNPRCVPPWDFGIPADDKDFRRKVTEARKLTPQKPRGWLLEDDAYAPVDPAMAAGVAEMIEKSHASTMESSIVAIQEGRVKPIQSIINNLELDFLTRPTGLLGEICEWINETAISPQPFLTLACALTFCGTLFGRKVRDELDSRTNLYCMGIAKSSAGKNHAPKQIRKICQEAGCLDFIGGINTTGDAAIESRLERYPASLFMWDEIGFLLSHANSGMSKTHAGLVPFLMQLYSSASNVFLGREYADSENQRTITQPCCCIYGSSSPERFAPGLSEEQLQDGFLARCLVFRTCDDPPKHREKCADPVPQSIIDQVSAWHGRMIEETDGKDVSVFATFHSASGESHAQPPEQLIVPGDPGTEKIFISLDDEARAFGKENPILAVLWRKAEENARKVALILAASKSFDSPRITVSMADYSCRLIRYLLLSFGRETLPTIVSGQIDLQKQKLLKIIGEKGVKGCSVRDITRKARWSNKKQRSALLADLSEAEEIVSQLKGKKTYFWTTENYLQFFKQQESNK